MRAFEDSESGRMVYEDDLRREFETLREIDPETYDYSFERYVENCTCKNGALERVNVACRVFKTMWNVDSAKAWLDARGIRYAIESDPHFMFKHIIMLCTEDRYDEFVLFMKSL